MWPSYILFFYDYPTACCPQLATTSIYQNHGKISLLVLLSKEYISHSQREAKEILPTKLTYILLCKYSHFSFRSSLACFLFVSSCYNMGNLFVFFYYYYIIIMFGIKICFILCSFSFFGVRCVCMCVGSDDNDEDRVCISRYFLHIFSYLLQTFLSFPLSSVILHHISIGIRKCSSPKWIWIK